MPLKPPSNFDWPESWQPITDEVVASSFLAELLKEVGPGHRLFQRIVKAVARRLDCDDVLFQTLDSAWPLAAVHLTWSGSTEPDPAWPATTFFAGWEDWRERSSEA